MAWLGGNEWRGLVAPPGMNNRIKRTPEGGTPPHQLTELPNGEVCARLLSDGVPETFFASTTPPDFTRFGNLIDYSRQRYTRSRVEVEDKIARWYGTRTPAG